MADRNGALNQSEFARNTCNQQPAKRVEMRATKAPLVLVWLRNGASFGNLSQSV